MRDLYEKFYFFELDRKSKIQSALTVPISISAFGAASIGYSIKSYKCDDTLSFFALFLSSLSSLSFLFVLYFCFHAIGRKRYITIPTMDHFLARQKGLTQSVKRKTDVKAAEAQFEEELVERLASSSAQNSVANDLRADALYKANIASFVLILFSLMSSAMILVDNEFICERPTMPDERKPAAPAQPQTPQLPPNRDNWDGANVKPPELK